MGAQLSPCLRPMQGGVDCNNLQARVVSSISIEHRTYALRSEAHLKDIAYS